MSQNDFSALITPARKSGAVKAYADVRIETLDGALVLRGFSVVQKPGQSPWVGLPQKPGTTPGKYFPMLEIEGDLRPMITKVILDAYNKTTPKP